MNPPPSLRLTAVFCASTLAVLGVLKETETTSATADSPLPPEIVAAEADYEARQQALEADLHRRHLLTLLLTPEERRAQLLAWPEENRAILEAQAARSEAIDALYDRYQIPPLPGPLDELAAIAPLTAEEASSLQGRHWALTYEVAQLREAYADDSEALRAALMAWEEAHGEAFRQLGVELAAEAEARPATGLSGESLVREAGSSSLVEAARPEGETPVERQLAALQDRVTALYVSHPNPARREEGPPATLEEIDAWRARILELTAPLEAEMQPLWQQIAELEHQRLIEYVHEHTR